MPTHKITIYVDVDRVRYATFVRKMGEGEWIDHDGDTLPKGLSDALDELEAQIDDDPMNTMPVRP